MKRFINHDTIKRFEDYLLNEERSAATIEKYLRDVRCFADFVKDAEITKQLVLEYKNSLPESYELSSANSMLAALNSFLRFLGWHDLCVKRFKIQREAFCSEEKELTRDEYIRLLNAASSKSNERLSLIIQTICATGIRVSELQYITVEALRRGEAAVFCKGKSRRIFIVAKLRKKLLKYVAERKILSGAVFITKSGSPISRNKIWKEMKSLCKDAMVNPKKVFPHNLRHLFARTFYGIERDIAKLADVLGHSSIDTTRIYIVTTGAEHKRKLEHMRLVL
jgi:site-specific recombinase XerD